MSSKYLNDGYQLFVEIFPDLIQGDSQANESNIPGEGRLVRKAQIKQVYKSDTTHQLNTHDHQQKTLVIRRPREKQIKNITKDCFRINIVMTDKITYIETFDAKEIIEQDALPPDVDPIKYARTKRDERYNQLRQMLTNQPNG